MQKNAKKCKIFARIRGFFYCIFFLLSVLFVICLFAFTNNQEKIHKIRRIWAKIQLKVLRVRVEFIGELDKNATMIMMNHQSMLDIIALEALYERNLAWVAKKEIRDLPVFKYTMTKPRLICVDRKNPRSIIGVIKEARERLAEGRVLAIFPDGTRSKTDKILKFQVGAKVLAEKLALKVQPLLIIDSARLLDSKDFTIHSGVLKIVCLGLIDTSEEGWLEKTHDKMQEILDAQRAESKGVAAC